MLMGVKTLLTKQIFKRFNRGELTDNILAEALQLFNENYGVWGKDAAKSGPFAKPVTIEDRLTGNDNDNIYGLMSSYPAACLAAVKVFRSGINNINLNFIYKYAEAAINVLLISYVKDAKLYGSIFDFKNTSGVVLLVYTSFFIDYIKPLKALIWVREGLD
ncbi:uncharacterized protein K441DRAFT_688416 [Cenococcum geophilum 1.58]|uniref:uncharacterized protein n=1 Tax=Cenococcum geophilum 1.58 TaxID=794803 RepID=UPI00358E1369|nr:hypothetical protein K441DRAFT_688416 [Cenococcum geophilum 1.58]